MSASNEAEIKSVSRLWSGGSIVSRQSAPTSNAGSNSVPNTVNSAATPPIVEIAQQPNQPIVASSTAPLVFKPIVEPVIGTVSPSGAPRILPLEARVNGDNTGTWVFVEIAGVLYAPRDAFSEWRVRLAPNVKTIDFKGQPYTPVSVVSGSRAKIDFPNQSIDLTFSPEAFTAQRVTQETAKRPVISPVLPSAFLNYDFNYAASASRNSAATQDLGLLTEVGLSNEWGVLTTSQAGTNLINNRTISDMRRWRRLETTFRRDFPDDNRTLRVGDASTRGGMWGRNTYFGGIQFGTNFALTPGFIRQPLPVLKGLSATPSTVELYVNDVLRQVSSVPTGPFTLDNFPVMTGGGETRLVVRDILGRETVIVQSFLASGLLLAKGLNDWSIETGVLRRNLGTRSNDYGSRFASGTWSRGISDSLTIEGRVEVTSRSRATGLGLVLALPMQLVGKSALAFSHDDVVGNGSQWLAGFERQGLRSSLSFDIRGASRNFQQLGQDVGTPPIKLQVAGNLTWSLDRSSFGIGFARVSQYSDIRISTISGNYSLRIGDRSNLTLTASHAVAGGTGTAVGLSVLVPLEDNRVFTTSVSRHNGGTDFYTSTTQNPLVDAGTGWRVLAGQQDNHARAELGSYYLGRYGRVASDASFSADLSVLRLGATGGVVIADGHVFATRRLDDSYAVAEVKGYGDVGIGLGSNLLTRTDANGVALIPRMVPYQTNSVRINPAELPISAELDSIEQLAVPTWRSAVKVTFPVRSGRGALLRIILDDKDVAPLGATVQIEGDQQVFYVARRGEAFVTGLQTTSHVSLKWNEQQCMLDVTLPPESPDEIARVGPLQCKGVTR